MTAGGFEFGKLICLAALSVWVTMVASLRLDAGEPVARWVADDWSGGTAIWVDRVGGKIATSYGSPVKATTQFGGSASSSGIVFDGVDDYFEVASDQNPIAGQNRVTIVALFKATQGATGTDGNHWNYPGPINAESGGSPNDFGLTIGTDGLAHAFFNESFPTFTPISVVDGLVHTMILTWSDTNDQGDGIARFYLDGVLAGFSEVQDNGSGIVNDLIRFGRERETSTRWFRGTVGELRFYASIEDPAALHASMSNVVPTLGFLSTTEAAGGDVVPISDSNIHTFRQSGSFVPSTSGTVEVLVVGGGGGGGGSFAGGGGGGGGVVSSTSYAVNAGEPISVIVGLGGAGGSFSLQGENGGLSQFGSLTALGGGGGGTYPGIGSGRNGGSGGGAGYAGVPGAGQVGQGSLGGAFGTSPSNHGGGGGGAGGTPVSSGIGGVGIVSSISGLASYYAGGGAAGTDDSVPLAGGLGGGGVGGQGLVNGLSGVANTGGGGGGGGGLSTVPVGGSGGSGVVIVRYSSFRTLSVMGSATQSSFSTISGSVSGTDPDPNTTLVYGIIGGEWTATAGQVSKTGSFGTLTLNTATGAYSFAPLAAGINSLQTSASEGYTLTVTDGVATASVGLTVNILVEQLALTTQPAGVISGAIMTSPPVVEIRDSQGNRTASTGAVSVSIDSGTGGALSGTLSVNAVNGVATFSDLTMTGTLNTSYTLKFNSSGCKASSTRGQVEWAYVVRNGLGVGRSQLYIDMRQFTGTGINPSQVNTIQLLGLYSGSVSWISTDPNSWSTFEIPSALSNIPDIAISYYSGSSNDSGVRLMRLGEESYGIQANFTFALPFTSTTSAAFTVNLPPTLAAIGVSGTEDTPLTRKSVQGITLNSAVVAAGLQPVSDASGRYFLQATLGQPIAGPASAVSGMQLNSGFWFTEQFSAALDGRNLVGAKLESKIRASVILRGASIDAPEATVMGPEISRLALGVPPSTRLTVLPVAGSGEVWIRVSGVPSGRWLIQYQDRLHSNEWLDEGLVELDGDGLGAVRAATGVGEMRFYRLVQQ